MMGALVAGLSEGMSLLWLALGGYAITGAANAANQIWERDSDALMERTRSRPLPAGLLSPVEGVIVALTLFVVGIGMLSLVRWEVALLGGVAWALYVLAYTPLKKHGPIAVLVGAFPGALPPVIGYWAVRPEVSPVLVALFVLQFVWQFPHFWVIALLAQGDYARAGFRLLPFSPEKAQANRLALWLSVWALPVAALALWPFLPWQVGLWSFSIGLPVAFLSGGWVYGTNPKNLRYLLLALTAYLTFLYLGIWLLL
jgi:protoheme IX farnesyltransferase